MPSRHFIIFSLLVAMTQSVQAEETKTTYSISGSNATVTTVVKKASSDTEKLMHGFLFEKIAAKLRGFPMVTGIEYNNEIKPEIKSNEWQDYWEHKRNYPVMVHLALPTAVTMMLKVEESFRKCKSPAEKAAKSAQPIGDYDGGDYGGSLSVPVDCSLGSTVKVTGPFTVYGNFASSMDMDRLLREKQSITYEVSRDWSDKTNLKLEGRFMIDSELFDQNLMKFLGGLNAKPAGTEAVLTRNNLLLGIARILRVQNERMVEK